MRVETPESIPYLIAAEPDPTGPTPAGSHPSLLLRSGRRAHAVRRRRPETFEAFGAILMPILGEVGVDPGEPAVMPIHQLTQTASQTAARLGPALAGCPPTNGQRHQRSGEVHHFGSRTRRPAVPPAK